MLTAQKLGLGRVEQLASREANGGRGARPRRRVASSSARRRRSSCRGRAPGRPRRPRAARRRPGRSCTSAPTPGDVGVEAVAVPAADDLLDDHRHLLVRRGAAGRARGRRARREEGRGVDELDRLDQPAEARLGVGLVVGDHLRGVDAGERLVERVLEQARGAHRQRRVHLARRAPQVADELGRQVAPRWKACGDAASSAGASSTSARRPLRVDEGVEDVGGEHRPARARRRSKPATAQARRPRAASSTSRRAQQQPLRPCRPAAPPPEPVTARWRGVEEPAGRRRGTLRHAPSEVTPSRGRGRPAPRG